MDEIQLKLVIAEHEKWLDTNGEQGKCADLQGANLIGASLRWVNLEKADLEGANLEGNNLESINWERVNLKGANLKGANLRWAHFKKSDLQGANLQGVDLQGANLIGANLEDANMGKSNLEGANLRWAYLENTNLIGANLKGVNLKGSYLKNTNFQDADLQGADYHLELFRHALNVPKYLRQEKSPDKKTPDIYTQQISSADRQIQQLEQEKKQIEQQLNNEKEELQSENSEITERLKKIKEELEAELEAERTTKKQATSKQQLLEEMKGAIQPILAGINADKVIIERYKKQSLWLMGGGIICFLFVIIYLGWQLWPRGVANTEGSFHILQIISPGLVLALIGTGLLRHDWKIRQLTLKLIEQNNKIDIAMGLLQTSLNLSNIGSVKQTDGIPDLVRETFKEARTALLFKDATPQKVSQNYSPTETKNIEEDLLKKVIKSTTQQ